MHLMNSAIAHGVEEIVLDVTTPFAHPPSMYAVPLLKSHRGEPRCHLDQKRTMAVTATPNALRAAELQLS